MKARHLDKYMPEVIKGVRSEIGSRRTAAYLDQRDAERVPIRAYVSYMTDERMGISRGQGWLVDLSKSGCKIMGPVLMVGTNATLVLYLPDEKDPLCIADAKVTWSDGESFGLRFPKLQATDRQRLQDLVLKFATLRGRSETHTAFRFA
jgi:hypothetical protein